MTRPPFPLREGRREARAAGTNRRRWRCRGLTVVELLIIAAMVATVAAIGVPAYNGYRGRARITQAIVDIRTIEHDLLIEESSQGAYPNSLAQIGRAGFSDPWGRPYQYLLILGSTTAKGQWRKDHFLVPLNTDFDLYSLGSDGQSKAPLTAQSSRDDIVRANNGEYVGLASDY